MQRPIPWWWIALALVLLLAPGFTARVVFDVLEGLTLLLVFGPLLLVGAGLLAWQLLKPRFLTCPRCGTLSVAAVACPACGTSFTDAASFRGVGGGWPDEPAARDAVIDVQVQDVSEES